MINSKSSRYSSLFDNDKDNEARTISERVITKSQPYFTHVTESNESFTSLAAKYLNNEKLYWYIADQNPQIRFPDLIPVGTIIRIPLA
jgi:hypothetical protein